MNYTKGNSIDLLKIVCILISCIIELFKSIDKKNPLSLLRNKLLKYSKAWKYRKLKISGITHNIICYK